MGPQLASGRAQNAARTATVELPFGVGVSIRGNVPDSTDDQSRMQLRARARAIDSPRPAHNVAARTLRAELVLTKNVGRQLAGAPTSVKLKLAKVLRRLEGMPWPPEPDSGVRWAKGGSMPGGLVVAAGHAVLHGQALRDYPGIIRVRSVAWRPPSRAAGPRESRS